MSGRSTANNGEEDGRGVPEGREFSRREFLKIAGIAGAAVGMGAGLGGFLAACGAGTTTTTGAPGTTATTGAVATTGSSGAAVSTGASTSQEPIVIGLLNEQTGYISNLGMETYKGAVLAFKAAPSQIGGRQIKYVLEDPASDPSIALDKARKLVEVDKAVAVLSPIDSASAVAIASYMDTAQVPFIRNCPGAKKIALTNMWTWQPVGIQNQYGYTAGVYAGDTNHKAASILALECDDGHGFMDGMKTGFAQKSGTILQEQWYPVGTSDFAPFVTKIDAKADVLFSWVASDSIIPGYKTLYDFQVYKKMDFISPEGWYDSESIWGQAKDAITHVTFAAPWINTFDTGGSQKFIADFKGAYNYVPSYVGAAAYHNVELLVDVLTRTNGDTTNQALAKALDATSLDTLLGHLTFVNRIAVFPIFMVKINKQSDTVFVPAVMGKYVITPQKTSNDITFTATKAT